MNRLYSTLSALMAFLILCIALVLTPEFAFAADEAMDLGTIESAAKRPDDRSRQALISIFGSVVTDPLGKNDTPAGETVFSSVFMVFNATLLVIAVLFCIYYIVSSILSSARDGNVKDTGKPWGVIRMVLGLSFLVPLPSGWSLAQLMMLWAASILGIGTANLATDAATAAFQDGKGMILEPARPDSLELARQIFEIDLCARATNADYDRQAAMGINVRPGWRQESQTMPAGNGFIIEAEEGRKRCGGAFIAEELLEPQSALTSWIPGVNTQSIAQAHLEALKHMQAYLLGTATGYVDMYLASKETSITLPDPTLYIEHAAREYENHVVSAAKDRDGDLDTLAGELTTSLTQKGWWMLGAWYQTFAQANHKIASTVETKVTVIGETLPNERKRTHEEVLQVYLASITQNQDSPLATGNALQNQSEESTLAGLFHRPMQKLVNAMVQSDFDVGSDHQNPLVRIKNLGDTALNTASTVIILQAGANAAMSNVITGNASKFLGFKDLLATLNPYLIIISIVLVTLGITLGLYIPFLPFIIWFGAIMNWLVIVIEAVVAAPLWALAHLISDDRDGMGQRTMHGYLFLLSVVLRPPLMVIGFFAAGGILVVGGMFLNEAFATVVANVQYDSFTGIFSILGILFVYASICLHLVHTCFNLIFIIPDQVISWIGGHASSALGRDAQEKTKNTFLGALGKSEGTADKAKMQFDRRPKKPNSGTDASQDGMKG